MFIGVTPSQRECTHAFRKRQVNGGENVEQCSTCRLLDFDLRVDDWLFGLTEVLQHQQGRTVLQSLLFGVAADEEAEPDTEWEVELPQREPAKILQFRPREATNG